MDKDMIKEKLMQYFNIDKDCDFYVLTRDKIAFQYGTVTLDDFKEFTEEQVDDIVQYLCDEEGHTGKNLVDLGFNEGEPIGFKFDTRINKPVLMKRCGNYYYAYPSKTGWVFYRSRYLGERDKEIIDISFDDWAHKVLEVIYKDTKEVK